MVLIKVPEFEILWMAFDEYSMKLQKAIYFYELSFYLNVTNIVRYIYLNYKMKYKIWIISEFWLRYSYKFHMHGLFYYKITAIFMVFENNSYSITETIDKAANYVCYAKNILWNASYEKLTFGNFRHINYSSFFSGNFS